MKTTLKIRLLIASLTASLVFSGCDLDAPTPPKSDSGVTKATARVATGSDGLTTEQRNVKARVEEDNKLGAIKHLYVVSPMTGDVLLYSTVKGKVTSGGKRLSPTSIVVGSSGEWQRDGYPFGRSVTSEVLQDDGTYGSSNPYIFWWDIRGVYHQHFIGSAELHVSSEPLNFPKVVLNLEALAK
jgi:hypothetical protein